MKRNKVLLFNNLKVLVSAVSISVLTACQFLEPSVSEPVEIKPEPVTISYESARHMVGQSPLDLFTEYDDSYQCLFSVQEPQQNEAPWVEPTTVWQRIGTGMTLDYQTPKRRIDSQFNWYKNHPSYMSRVSKRAGRYIYYVTEEVSKRGLPLELALLPIVESAFDPFAYSHGRASGMWQFIPGTARHYKLDQNWWYDGRRDVIASTDAALNYLTYLNELYQGDWLLALAAYNSGQGTVGKAIRKNKKKGKATDFWSLDLPKETRSYVPKLLALAKLIKHPRRYDIDLYPVPNQPYFAAVDTQSQIDLAQAAQLAEVDIDEIYRLNPGFNRWATAPSGPHLLLVPESQKAIFEHNLSNLPPEQRLNWTRYKIRNGDSLLSLATRFNTTPELIKEVNNISGNTIRAGQSLMIPQAARNERHYALSAEQRLNNIQKKRTAGSDSQQLFHTVRSGESFWSIARRYQVSVSTLAKWNGMAPRDPLKIGQKLSVWTTPRLKTAALSGQRDAVVRKVGYKVRSGDSLARIAQRFNLSIKDILKWNSVNTKKYLQPGQRLTLYVDITSSVN